MHAKRWNNVKWKQPKVGFAILVLLTVITLASACKHNIDYLRYVQEIKREYTNLGINPDILDPWPWPAWGMGPLVIFLGFVTIDSWIVSSIIWLARRKKHLHA